MNMKRKDASAEENTEAPRPRIRAGSDGRDGRARAGFSAQVTQELRAQTRMMQFYALACYSVLLIPLVLILVNVLGVLPDPIIQLYAILILAVGALLPIAAILIAGRGTVKAIIFSRTGEMPTYYAKPTKFGQAVTTLGAYNLLPGFSRPSRFGFLHGLYKSGPTYMFIEGNPNPIGFDEDGIPAIELDSQVTKQILQQDVALKIQRAGGRQKFRDMLLILALGAAVVAAALSFAAWDNSKKAINVALENWAVSQEIKAALDNARGVFTPASPERSTIPFPPLPGG